MTAAFIPLHTLATVFILVWDVWMTGQIGRARAAPRVFATITGIGGLLLLPGLLVALATSSLLYGRALSTVAWLWPATLLIFAVQAWYATSRALVTPTIGFPIAVYNTLIALAACVKYAVFLGVKPPESALALVAAQYGALVATTSPLALTSSLLMYVPMLAPAFPARYRASKTVRLMLGILAGVWAGLIIAKIWPGGAAVRSYDRYVDTRLRERPEGDFAIGIKIFPDLHQGPPPLAIREDLALADTIDADVVSITLAPEATTNATLDSLGRTLDAVRRDSTLLIVSLDDAEPWLAFGRPVPLDAERRISAVRRIARRLRPDYLLPVVEPYGRAAQVYGVLPVQQWASYLARAAAAAHTVSPRTKVGVSASSYTARDSTLFAWAAAAGSPIDVVGFTIFPGVRGAREMDAATFAADRFLRATRSTKEHWIWSAGSLPAVHGDASQERALSGLLSWATSRPVIRGFIVAEAGDYDSTIGLRAPSRRLRPATWAVARAIRALRENR
jgi:hypothetical protein